MPEILYENIKNMIIPDVFKDRITKACEIITKYNPIKIILFGSCAKNRVFADSDIDLAIIFDNIKNKRDLVMSIRMELDLNLDCDSDVVIYNSEDFNKYSLENSNFSAIIMREGVLIYE